MPTDGGEIGRLSFLTECSLNKETIHCMVFHINMIKKKKRKGRKRQEQPGENYLMSVINFINLIKKGVEHSLCLID
jgi:hypothetical protein